MGASDSRPSTAERPPPRANIPQPQQQHQDLGSITASLHSLKMPQYVEEFHRQGYDDIHYLAALGEDEEIG